jgi:hypothetical protein
MPPLLSRLQLYTSKYSKPQKHHFRLGFPLLCPFSVDQPAHLFLDIPG